MGNEPSNDVEPYVFANETSQTRYGLSLWGHTLWPSDDISAFESSLINGNSIYSKVPFGKGFYFTIGANVTGDSRRHFEMMWPVATWILDSDDQSCRPYGKIFATKELVGWYISFWYDANSLAPQATSDYYDGLNDYLRDFGTVYLQGGEHGQ